MTTMHMMDEPSYVFLLLEDLVGVFCSVLITVVNVTIWEGGRAIAAGIDEVSKARGWAEL